MYCVYFTNGGYRAFAADSYRIENTNAGYRLILGRAGAGDIAFFQISEIAGWSTEPPEEFHDE